MASNFFKDVGDGLADFVDWVRETLADEAIRKSIAEDLGLQPGQSLEKPKDQDLGAVDSYRSKANPDKEAFIGLLNDVRALYQNVRVALSGFGDSDVTRLNSTVYLLFDLLALNYVRLYLPRTYFLVQALSAIVEDTSALDEDPFAIERFFAAIAKAEQFVLSPIGYAYRALTAGVQDEERARKVSDRIFPFLATFFALAKNFGSVLAPIGTREISYGWDGVENPASLSLAFSDLAGLAVKLQDASDPLARYLHGRLTGDVQQLVNAYDGTSPPSETLRNTLADALKMQLQDTALFDTARFAKVQLSERTRKLLGQNPVGEDRGRLNKSLLEDAYPDQITRNSKPLADGLSERMLTVAFPLSQDPTPTSRLNESVDLTLAIIPGTHAEKAGLFIGVGGDGTVEIPLTDRWKFALEASAKPAFSLLLEHSEWRFFPLTADGRTPTDAPLNVALLTIPDQNDITYAVPHPDETRLEIGQLSLSFGFDGTRGAIKAQALRCALVLATKDHDGFLAKVLPSDGLRVPFSFGLGFSTEKRFFTEGGIEWPTGQASNALGLAPTEPGAFTAPGSGGARRRRSMARAAAADGSNAIPNLSGTSHPELGSRIVIPIGKALLSVSLDHLLLSLAPASESASAEAKTEVSVALAIKIGPVLAAVDRIGFEMGLSFPESGGNIGFADFSLGFKPPSGALIKVDSSFVTGGGFLFLDSEKGQYAGFIQLTIQDMVTVAAIGLITTRLPNGAKGFSFVVMITVQDFRPIQLGLGFTLTGIGGLLAINRGCNEDFLREGIKNKTLDDLLFPRDPIRNAVQIFATLNNAFPAQDGSYLFGPVVQICWGAPPLIRMDLGLILELGNRRRLIILGRVSAIMPTEAHDLLRLQMNALGVIDFDRDSISLDAVLYDSRFAGKFPVTGSMALRLNWGSAPVFALSVGGLHPAFKPPPSFPTLERLAISFANTDDFRLRAETYFGITSNTLQFGAKTELFARAGSFSVAGGFGYDVLILFDPFSFLADVYAAVQVKYGSHNLFKVVVEGELAGPRPLHIKGRVTFEIFWCDITIRIDHTLISGDPPPQLEPVLVAAKLKAALDDPRNWSGQLTEGERRTVTLREPATPGQIALHPLGRLSVKQTVVPLDLEISKFGNAIPADARLFSINRLSVNGKDAEFSPVKDFFAPAQFLELSDDEKLAAPSFEAMTAGISVGSDSFLFTVNDEDILEDETIEYETIIVGEESETESAEQPPAPPRFAISAEFLDRHLSLGAAARSDLRHTGTARYRPAGGRNSLPKKGWTVASAEDGSQQGISGLEAGSIVSYAESFQALQQLKQDHPARARTLMLMRVPRQ